MSLGDNLDFELFGISDILNEFEPSFGETEDSDTTGFTPQTPLSLPLHVEPSLLKSNSVAPSSNFHLDSFAENPVIDITQASSPENIVSSCFSDVDTANDNALKEGVKDNNTFPNTNTGPARPNDASISSNGLTTQLSLNDDTSFATQSQRSLTCGSDTQGIPQNVYTNATQPSTLPAQPAATSLPYPLPYHSGTSTTGSQTIQPFNPSFQQYLLPYSDDTTGRAAVGTFQTAQPSTSSYYSLPYTYNAAKLNPNSVQPSTSSPPHPSSYGTVGPNTARSRSSMTQVSRPSQVPVPSRPYATYNASIDMPGSLPSTRPSVTSFRPPLYGNVGVNMEGSLNRTQPYTSSSSLENALSYGTVGLNTTELTRLPHQSSRSLPQPSSLSVGYNSSVDWNAAYAALGLVCDNYNDNYNTNADFTNINDASVSHTQPAQPPTSNEAFYAIQPQYYTTNQGPRSQDIRQGMFPNVSTAPSTLHNADTSVPSYTQSTNNATPFPIHPQYYTLNQNSGLQNTNLVGFTNVPQSSKSSAQHSSTPGINGMSQHTWHSTQVPVNNDAFFAFQVNQGSRLQDTSQGRFTNVPRQPSTASLQTIARQTMTKSVPMTQPFNPAFSRSVNLPYSLDYFSMVSGSNVVIPNVARQNAKSQVPSTLPNANGPFYNRNVQSINTNLIVNNPSSVTHNQRLMEPPCEISTTRYNAYATVPNDEVPPTSGVPSADLVNQQQLLYPAPLSYTALGQGQGGTHHPPFHNFSIANNIPNGRNHGHSTATIPIPTHPVFTHQPAPMTHQSRPVKILPPFPIPGSTSSTSKTSTRTKRKRVNDDEESAVDGKPKRRRRGSMKS